MERVPIKTNPKLFDEVVAKLQNLFADNLLWLDHAFGLCEFLAEVKDGKKFTSANIYRGKGEYSQIMPCRELGNFCMFVLRDPQEIGKRDAQVIKSPISIIFWYDMRDVRPESDERPREAVKADILGILNRAHLPWLSVTRIYEKPEAVFSDFSYDHTENQYLMSPYAGLRIDGIIMANVPCWSPESRKGDFNNDFNNDFD